MVRTNLGGAITLSVYSPATKNGSLMFLAECLVSADCYRILAVPAERDPIVFAYRPPGEVSREWTARQQVQTKWICQSIRTSSPQQGDFNLITLKVD